jgi:hypothetical protein
MNHAAEFGFPAEDTPAEYRRRDALDRPRAPHRRGRGTALVFALVAAVAGLSGVDPFAPLKYVETDRPKRHRGGRR